MALTIPAVVTRNQSSLTNNDWRSLLDFFQKPGSSEAMVAFCQKKLGIVPEVQKTIEEEEKELTEDYDKLEKRMDDLKQKKAAASAPAAAQ